MDTNRMNHRQSSDLSLALEKAGLTPEIAANVIGDRTGALALAMVAVVTTKLGIVAAKQPVGPNSLAARRRAWYKRYFKRLNLKGIAVPIPQVSDEEINRRAALAIPQKLFFIHIISLALYEAFMKAVGQSDHWTLNHDDRHKIVWDFAAQGYWIWAEVPESCPRLKTSWNTLNTSIHLLSLVEYVEIRHSHKAETQVMLDKSTYCWLRTRYDGSGALAAIVCEGKVYVHANSSEDLSEAFDDYGGGLAEVVQN